MKQSQFNFLYTRDNGEIIAYNTFSKALVCLNEAECALLGNVSFKEISKADLSLVEELKRQGFIVEDSFDELAFLRYFHYKTKFANDQLSLTIAPTLDCNFACPYCYENARKGRMTKEVQDKLLEYIRNRFKEGVKKLDITWYGGEPLLCTDIIDYLSSNIKKMCEDYNINFGMSLVTNGYLLTSEIISMFERNSINDIQVTLDGMEENHNKRRYLRSGAGTFSRIVSNLSLFKGTSIRVNIRMNVDHINQKDYPYLKKKIESIEGVKIGVYPSAVENLNERENGRTEYYMSTDDYEEFILDSYLDEDICDGCLDVVDDRRYFCAAELENSYVVDEQGNFYKCWDEIGNLENICFNVLSVDDINYAPIVRYVADDPFSNSLCKACKFLPLCFGGCRFQKNKLKKSVCNFTDETLRAFIETKYMNG